MIGGLRAQRKEISLALIIRDVSVNVTGFDGQFTSFSIIVVVTLHSNIK